ncbi:DUF1190 domain-containing protein [Teredinibacter turnerae]|uniref:DUF1190 domain-containing protein n=1 Tax=Teredinibacter turnerae TaxID=2426 RepID=UPI000366D020|nr:DUF1190 domain-containing protein [Teredinibacter turnerae]
MKRSQHVLLPRLRKGVFPAKRLAVAIAAVVAAGCSMKQEAKIFTSVDECESDANYTQAECAAAYEKALADARKTAPRYSSRSDCEYEFGPGSCQNYSSGPGIGSYFIPAMAGFMIGQALQHRSNGYYGPAYNPVFYHYDGGYNRNRAPVWTTADGTTLGNGSKRSVNVGKSTFKPKPAVTRTMSRGGFGSTASAKSSWGGSSRSGGWGG